MVEQFERAKQLFTEGIRHFEAGRYADAERQFHASLALVPGRASTLTNLALTHLKLGKPEQALASLEQVLGSEPDNADAWFQRGVALDDLGRDAEALGCYDRALGLQPERGEGWFRHGQALQRLEQPERALASYDKAVSLDPSHAQAWSQRGGILQDFKRLDEAAASFEKAIANGADAELNGYFLASARGRGAPAHTPKQYVESLFDEYADRFEEHLRVLNYQAPGVLAAQLQQIVDKRFAAALDLGCGTGLCGPLLKPRVDRLDGVDLSRNMLDKARTLGVYDRLVHADIGEYLQTTPQRYDLVVCADVYIYVGDLDAVFAGVQRVMTEGGMYCFTAEAADDASDFVLTPGLRYAHSQRYLRELADRHGFDVVRFVQQPIREDQRQPIAGLYVYLSKR